jgi:hypothetical protein
MRLLLLVYIPTATVGSISMARTRLEIAKRDIVKHVDELQQNLFSRSDMAKIVTANREFWRFAQTTTADDLIGFLMDKSHLGAIRLESEHGYRALTRYFWRIEPSPYRLAVSLRPRSYLSHFSALSLHDLTNQIPKTIYANQEQTPKISRTPQLEQHRIDTAFRNKPRSSKLIYNYKENQLVLLSGKSTGNLGVVERTDPSAHTVPVTNLERTLIDIVVRPQYAGGIHEVCRAYEAARGRASLNKLVATLVEMELLYPYHQAIGFLAERAEFRQRPVELLRQFDIEFDFYLVHGMKEMEYSERWKLFYPEGL